MIYGYIYKTTNLLSGKVYIGQKQGEFCSKYLGSGIYVLRAIKKYGKLNFRVVQIASAEDKSELNVLEIHYIRKYKKTHRSYNISPGGTGGWTGTDQSGKNNPRWGAHLSDATKKKISETQKLTVASRDPNFKRKPISEEARKNMGRAQKRRFSIVENHPMFSKHHSRLSRLKMSKAKKGKPGPKHTYYVRMKIRKANLGHECSALTRRKIRIALKKRNLLCQVK